MDDPTSARPDDPLHLAVQQDLDSLSIAELDARIALLDGELARTRQKRESAAKFRSAADSLFKS